MMCSTLSIYTHDTCTYVELRLTFFLLQYGTGAPSPPGNRREAVKSSGLDKRSDGLEMWVCGGTFEETALWGFSFVTSAGNKHAGIRTREREIRADIKGGSSERGKQL